jgi:hypothetical protein
MGAYYSTDAIPAHQPDNIDRALARVCTHLNVTRFSGVTSASAVCHAMVAMLQTGIIAEDDLFARLGAPPEHMGMLGDAQLGGALTASDTEHTTAKISATVRLPNSTTTIYKSTIVTGLNDAPKVSADRAERYKCLLTTCAALPGHRPAAAKTVALAESTWQVGISDDVAVRFEDGEFLVGKVLRMRKRINDSSWCEYVRAVSLEEGKRDPLVFLQLAWYQEVHLNGTTHYLANDTDANDLADVELASVICPVDLSPAPEHPPHLRLGADYLTAIERNMQGEEILEEPHSS